MSGGDAPWTRPSSMRRLAGAGTDAAGRKFGIAPSKMRQPPRGSVALESQQKRQASTGRASGGVRPSKQVRTAASKELTPSSTRPTRKDRTPPWRRSSAAYEEDNDGYGEAEDEDFERREYHESNVEDAQDYFEEEDEEDEHNGRRASSHRWGQRWSSDVYASSSSSKPPPERVRKQPREIEKRVLPIQERRDEIVPMLCGEESSNVCCLVGETGSGKSTQVPQILMEEAAKASRPIRIAVTQPRRVAALNLATRVAREIGEEGPGDTVGYRIGGESMPGEHIDFCTTGYLLQLLLNAPEEFSRYTHVILDEVHERSAESDMLCLVVRLLVATTYVGTRLVIMSATLQSDLFSNYFASFAETPPSNIFVGARCFPVTEYFLDEISGALQLKPGIVSHISQRIKDVFAEEKTAKRLDPRHCEKFQSIVVDLAKCVAQPGTTILVFLPGISEISSLWEEAKSLEEGRNFNVFALHSMIPREEQELVFEEPEYDCTNVVLATDIAESSITLPHVVAVIDLGLHRRVDHDSAHGISALATKWISQAAATQRAGRAGRTQPGLCLRMYTRAFHEKMPKFEPPEVQSMPLDRLYLQAKQLGEKLLPVLGTKATTTAEGILTQMIQPPEITAIGQARSTNAEVGTIAGANEEAKITSLGRLCLQLPVDPRVSRLVWLGVLWGIPADAVVLGAVLSSMDPFSNPSPLFIHNERDFIDKLRGATSARLLFDGGVLSEPLMQRQLFLEWLADFHKNHRVYGAKEHIFRKRRKHTSQFSWHFSLSRGRMEHMISHVQDLALRIYRACDPESANAGSIRELIRGLGYKINDRGDLSGLTQDDWKPFLPHKVFVAEPFLLKGLLAASFSDQLFVGSYAQVPSMPVNMKPNARSEKREKHEKDIKRQTDILQAMAEHSFNAKQTVVMPANVKEVENYVEFVCGMKPTREVRRVEMGGEKFQLVELDESEGNRWQALESRKKAPLLEDPSRLPPEFNLLYQFEKAMRDAQKVNKSLTGWTYGMIPAHTPFLINWEWMKEFPGANESLTRCKAIFDRKNPVGFIGHVQTSPHGASMENVAMFAVAASVTGSEKPGWAFPTGVTTLAAGHIAFILVTACLNATRSGLKRFGFTTDGYLSLLYRSFKLPTNCIDSYRWELICDLRAEIRQELGREEAFVVDGGAWQGHGASLFDSPMRKKVMALLEALPAGDNPEPAVECTHLATDLTVWTVDLAAPASSGPEAFQPLAPWAELEKRRSFTLECATAMQIQHALRNQYNASQNASQNSWWANSGHTSWSWGGSGW